MYKQFFHLERNPFSMNPDPRFLCMTPQTREALAGLEHGIAARKGFVVLLGQVGTGKTTLLRNVLNTFDPGKVFTSFIFNPRLDVLDFLEFVLNDFGITPSARTKAGMLISLDRWLIERYRRNEICVIVVDEAQNLSTDLLEEIRLLTNLETSSDKLLQIVLSGQPELEDKLRQPDLRQLRQRVALWCRTEPITLEQIATYITRRLQIAGTSDHIFSPSAMVDIYRASRGIPRVINLICEHSLIHAYATQVRQVSPEIVASVVEDLDLESQPYVMSSARGSGGRSSAANGPANDSGRHDG